MQHWIFLSLFLYLCLFCCFSWVWCGFFDVSVCFGLSLVSLFCFSGGLVGLFVGGFLRDRKA